MKQFVYRKVFAEPLAEALPAGARYIYGDRIAHLRNVVLPILRTLGVAGLLKCALKLLAGRRVFCGIIIGRQLASYAWVNVGFCRHYTVEPDAAVIGPVMTQPAYRNRGLAYSCLASSINRVVQTGMFILYIDTSEQNLPMQKVIARCGFGVSVREYERGPCVF
jgi:hypothetical protein